MSQYVIQDKTHELCFKIRVQTSLVSISNYKLQMLFTFLV